MKTFIYSPNNKICMSIFSIIRSVVNKIGNTWTKLKLKKRRELSKLADDKKIIEKLLKRNSIPSSSSLTSLQKKIDSLLLRKNILTARGYSYIGKKRIKYKNLHFTTRLFASTLNKQEINLAVNKYKSAVRDFSSKKFEENFVDELESAENNISELLERSKEKIDAQIGTASLNFEKTRQKELAKKR